MLTWMYNNRELMQHVTSWKNTNPTLEGNLMRASMSFKFFYCIIIMLKPMIYERQMRQQGQ